MQEKNKAAWFYMLFIYNILKCWEIHRLVISRNDSMYFAHGKELCLSSEGLRSSEPRIYISKKKKALTSLVISHVGSIYP